MRPSGRKQLCSFNNKGLRYYRGKYTNPKSLKLNKISVTLRKDKTVTIKGRVTKVRTKKKLATNHAKILRFTSNNPTVATVDANGKVTAKETEGDGQVI
ncbi:MAG: Ig-like domain-containing protein [Eubacterium sp.]|nr:Ig-like domain-containing protein [Eubacterium sp.]